MSQLLTIPHTIFAEEPSATLQQCARLINARDHGEYTDFDVAAVLLPAYFELAAEAELDPLPLVAQLIHETSNLTNWWAQRPRRNPAGLGVTGRTSATQPERGTWQWGGPGRWVEGLAFPSWEDDAIPAHIGRMLAYALRDEQASAPQRRLIAHALSQRPLPARYRGCAPTLHDLDGRWAIPGHGYSQRLIAIITAIQDL